MVSCMGMPSMFNSQEDQTGNWLSTTGTKPAPYMVLTYFIKCIVMNVLYKLPRFYNAYATGGATIIFVHSRTLRVYP